MFSTCMDFIPTLQEPMNLPEPSCVSQALTCSRVVATARFNSLSCAAMSSSPTSFDALVVGSPSTTASMLAEILVSAGKASPLLVSDSADVVNRIIKDFDDKRVGLAQAADRIDQALEEKGLLKLYTLHPSMVGVDVSNRNGSGINALEVNLLASDICEVGWSWDACRHATCIEEKPGDSLIIDFNKRIVANSGLAPVKEGSIRYGSLSCSHTQQALRAIVAGCESDDPLMSQGGKFCLERLGSRDKLYVDAATQGLRWKVLDWRVREMYPRAPDLVQSARNIGATLNRKESEMQILLRLHSMSAAFVLKTGGSPPWAEIRRSIMRTRPACADKLDSMIAFVAARSGGASGPFLQQLSVFHRNFVEDSIRGGVPGALYSALADFPHHYLALSILKTAWTCPRGEIDNQQCVWVTATEVNALKNSKDAAVVERAKLAEELLSQSRVMTDHVFFFKTCVLECS